MENKTTLEMVREFHEATQLPINKITNEDLALRKFRVCLLFEELKELAQAGGIEDYFVDLAEEVIIKYNENPDIPIGKVDHVGELDALADLQYVLDGAVLSLGYDDIMYKASCLVHDSNMTKTMEFLEEATAEHKELEKKNPACTIIRSHGRYVIKRHDGKILKPSTYKPVELTQLVEEGFELAKLKI